MTLVDESSYDLGRWELTKSPALGVLIRPANFFWAHYRNCHQGPEFTLAITNTNTADKDTNGGPWSTHTHSGFQAWQRGPDKGLPQLGLLSGCWPGEFISPSDKRLKKLYIETSMYYRPVLWGYSIALFTSMLWWLPAMCPWGTVRCHFDRHFHSFLAVICEAHHGVLKLFYFVSFH